MLFRKKLLPLNAILEDIQKTIDELKKSKDKEDCLRKAYDILSHKYHGQRGATFSRPQDLAIQDINKLWAIEGFMHCTNINYVLKFLLVRSGFFAESDVTQKWTLIWYISLHQYLKVRIKDDKYINIDLWGKVYGTKFGDYAHGFH